VAEVGADRAYFDSVVAQGGEDAATLRFPVYCPRRRSRLSGREIPPGLPVPLNPGDIIHLGAWTAIQVFGVTY